MNYNKSFVGCMMANLLHTDATGIGVYSHSIISLWSGPMPTDEQLETIYQASRWDAVGGMTGRWATTDLPALGCVELARWSKNTNNSLIRNKLSANRVRHFYSKDEQPFNILQAGQATFFTMTINGTGTLVAGQTANTQCMILVVGTVGDLNSNADMRIAFTNIVPGTYIKPGDLDFRFGPDFPSEADVEPEYNPESDDTTGWTQIANTGSTLIDSNTWTNVLSDAQYGIKVVGANGGVAYISKANMNMANVITPDMWNPDAPMSDVSTSSVLLHDEINGTQMSAGDSTLILVGRMSGQVAWNTGNVKFDYLSGDMPTAPATFWIR